MWEKGKKRGSNATDSLNSYRCWRWFSWVNFLDLLHPQKKLQSLNDVRCSLSFSTVVLTLQGQARGSSFRHPEWWTWRSVLSLYVALRGMHHAHGKQLSGWFKNGCAGLPGGPVVKTPTANAGDMGSVLFWEALSC